MTSIMYLIFCFCIKDAVSREWFWLGVVITIKILTYWNEFLIMENHWIMAGISSIVKFSIFNSHSQPNYILEHYYFTFYLIYRNDSNPNYKSITTLLNPIKIISTKGLLYWVPVLANLPLCIQVLFDGVSRFQRGNNFLFLFFGFFITKKLWLNLALVCRPLPWKWGKCAVEHTKRN